MHQSRWGDPVHDQLEPPRRCADQDTAALVSTEEQIKTQALPLHGQKQKGSVCFPSSHHSHASWEKERWIYRVGRRGSIHEVGGPVKRRKELIKIWIVAALIVLLIMICAGIRLYHECRRPPDDRVPRAAFKREDDYYDKVLKEPHGRD